MIFSKIEAAPDVVEEEKKVTLGNSLKFNYVDRKFVMADGSPVRHTGIDAVKQWLELFVRTVPGIFNIYAGTGFGVSTTKLIGKKVLPAGAVISEIKREIEEGATLCPAIRSVYGFSFSGRTISFTVSTIFDETEAVTIEL